MEISVYSYAFEVKNASLEVVNSIVAEETQVGYSITYEDKDKFKNDYMAGRLEFTARPDVDKDSLLKLIEADIEATHVKELMSSSLLSGANPEDLQAPAPQEQVIAKKINKSSAIRMKNANKEIDWFAPSELPTKVAEGWFPTNRDQQHYPILSGDDKYMWTLNVDELGQVFAENQKVYIIDVNALTDAEAFRQMFPEKNYPSSIVVCSDSTPEDAKETGKTKEVSEIKESESASKAESVIPEIPTAMPEIPDGGNEVPTV